MARKLLLLSALALACACAWAKPARVPLDVQVNGQARPGIVGWLDGGELWLPVADLQGFGVKNLPSSTPVNGREAVPLKALGSQVKFDESELKLTVVLDAKDLTGATTVDMARIRNRPTPVTVANGLVFDYELGAGQAGGAPVFDAYTRTHASILGWQLLDERVATLVDGVALHTPLRTTLRRDWPQSGLRLDLGTLDVPEPGLSNWGSLRGVSFGTMRAGSASLSSLRAGASLATAVQYPSTADIYVNGVRQGTFNVSPGAFDVQGLRSFSTGATQVRAVIRDMFGNETVLDESRYVGENTIRAGAHDFAYQVGENPFAKEEGLQLRASHRIGVSDTVTVSAKAEARKGFAAAQLAAAVSVGNVGEVSAGVMGGRSETEPAQGYFVAHQYTAGNWSTATSLVSRPQPVFLMNGTIGVQRATQLSTRQLWALPQGNQLSAAAVLSRYEDNTRGLEFELGWSRKLSENVYLQAQARHSSIMGASGHLVLTWVPSAGYVGTSFTSADRNGTAQQATFTKTPALDETNWRLDSRVEHGRTSIGAMVERDLGPGTVRANASVSQNSTAARIGWRSGFLVGNGMATVQSNQANSALVVDAQGLEGIGVYRNNVLVGQTDKSGLFWVTDLPGYEEVRISLDENAIPVDRWYAGGEIRPVRPAPGSVVGVKFDIREVRSADVLLTVCEDCKPLTDQVVLFSSEGGAETSARMRSGHARVQGLLTGKQRVTTGDGACRGETEVAKSGPVRVLMECTP